ncbi:uncharacterized protein C14C4.01c [Aspergillus lentulus]|uniref:Uncharacterized protein C14C4.01c n=1 Tax=Aspergillus lentulus TaxID=293939 RepID=A0AAN4PLM2_ASPLE|nr:hypothetical protein CNMCM6069_007236 [Aspergillus lentulus]KAF4185861.1 hypothetical protein CNMCM7927_006163 [Aspergillus lentulus]KAF4207855.1 hypothetical protein CNMCM8927_002168 [Aspergillus lentulus]GAQ09105.1 uncharacterized protein C14C4.01c [Aspergillus lentulus]
MADPALELAETIQTASIKRNPSPRHDINPPTAASEKRPVARRSSSEADSIPSDIVDPSRMVRPISRRHTLPPLPDLRFEQSYLASLRGADTWGRVAWITIRDQVLLPLIQGTLWTLALSGWRYWNRTASLSGQTLGSRLRRWWYEVNNWKLPPLGTTKDPRLAAKVEDIWFKNQVDLQLTFSEFLQFYTAQFSNAGAD